MSAIMPWWGWFAAGWFVLWFGLLGYAICTAGVDPEDVEGDSVEPEWRGVPRTQATSTLPCAPRTHSTRYDMAILPVRRGDR